MMLFSLGFYSLGGNQLRYLAICTCTGELSGLGVWWGQVLGGGRSPPPGWRVPSSHSQSHSMGLNNLGCLLLIAHRAGRLSFGEPPSLLPYIRAFSKSFSLLGVGRRTGGST